MIDVIMPAYLPSENHHKLFHRAIRSLENQTYKNFNVIVVLNGCYTEYQNIIESVKTSLNIEWLTIEGKASGAIARNKGIKHSNAEFIAQLDADDQYHPEKIEKQIKFFKNNPEYSFVGTLAYDFRSENEITDSCFKQGQYQKHIDIARALHRENIMSHGSIMFRRADFLTLGGYNEDHKPGSFWPQYQGPMWEDWDLWKRAVKNGFKFYNIPERLYYWSVGTGVER